MFNIVDATVKFSAKSKMTPPTPIIHIEEPRKKTVAPAETPQKEK